MASAVPLEWIVEVIAVVLTKANARIRRALVRIVLAWYQRPAPSPRRAGA
jgi:hypothetical protein